MYPTRKRLIPDQEMGKGTANLLCPKEVQMAKKHRKRCLTDTQKMQIKITRLDLPITWQRLKKKLHTNAYYWWKHEKLACLHTVGRNGEWYSLLWAGSYKFGKILSSISKYITKQPHKDMRTKILKYASEKLEKTCMFISRGVIVHLCDYLKIDEN